MLGHGVQVRYEFASGVPSVTAAVPATPDPTSGFGMRGALPDVMSAFNERMQALADATRAMLADAAEAPGRIGQAISLLTDNGQIGSIGYVLGAAAVWLLLALLAAAVVRRLLRPMRARLRHAASDRAGRVAGHVVEALLVDLAPPATFLFVGIALFHLALGRSGRIF